MTRRPPLPPARASLLTPAGRGAIAVIAAEGDAALAAVDARFRAANGLPAARQRIGRIVFGQWAAPPERDEDVIVCRTGQRRLEVHCHGGVAAATRILSALAAQGCQIEPWQDWVRADGACAIAVEAEIALAAAPTRRTAAILLEQFHGALRASVESARDNLALATPESLLESQAAIATLIARAEVGLHLNSPWTVAIAGRPNVGKSSLLNALVGYQRAIVYNEPGTTRDVLTAETAIDGWPVRLADAAGMRATNDPLEQQGVALARRLLAESDLTVWVLDASTLGSAARNDPHAAADAEFEAETGQPPATPPIIVVNKSDLVSEAISGETCVITSATTGTGLEELLAAVVKRLVRNPPPTGAAVPFTQRQAWFLRTAAEAISQEKFSVARDALDCLLSGAELRLP